MEQLEEMPAIEAPPKKKRKPRAFSNALVRSPHYDAIMAKYYEIKERAGAVNLSVFHGECVMPYVPEFQYEQFRQFIRKLEERAADVAESVPAEALPESVAKDLPRDPIAVPVLTTHEEVTKLRESILSMDEATRQGLAVAFNIGLATLMDIATGKIQMSAKDRVELLFKAMKAQDSRVSTAAKLRKDDREQAAFEREFGEAAYIG